MEVQSRVERATERWIGPMKCGEGREQVQGRVVRFMDG